MHTSRKEGEQSVKENRIDYYYFIFFLFHSIIREVKRYVIQEINQLK